MIWKYNHKRVTKFGKHLQIVDNVLQSWQKAGYEDTYGDLVTWMVNFLYGDLMAFPEYKRYQFAVQIMSIIEKYNMNIFMSNEAEKVKEIQKISEQEVTFDECVQKAITSRKELIAQMENEITERLKSRAFKLGVKLTPKKERIDINDVLPPLEKKN